MSRILFCLAISLYHCQDVRGQDAWSIINKTGTDALYPTPFNVPLLTVTYPDYGFPAAVGFYGFHFFDIHGYTTTKSAEDCLRFCYAHFMCRAVNYVFSISRCVSLGSGVTADRLQDLWFDQSVDSIHAYFTTGPKPNAAIYRPNDPPFKSPFGLPAFTPNVYVAKFTRIIGGTSAIPYSYPWIVRIVNCDANNYCNVCGATLLPPDLDNNSQKTSSDLIVTAAHCVVTESNGLVQPSQITLRFGNYRDDLVEAHEYYVKARRIVTVQGFDRQTLLDDIAIIQLTKPVTFNKFINAIRLPSKDYPSNPTLCVAAGWGSYFDKSPQSTILQQAILPILTAAECSKAWPGFDFEKMYRICASSASLNKNSSTCQGDSGGPLVCPETIGTDQIFTLYGWTSFGDSTSCLARPSVFSRTFSYLTLMKSIYSRINTFSDNAHIQVPFAGPTPVGSRFGAQEEYYYEYSYVYS